MGRTLRVLIDPKPKGRPRFSQKSGTVYTPTSTQNYEYAIRDAWTRGHGDKAPYTGAVRLEVTFIMPRPGRLRWKKKAMPMQAHDKRPDLDNLLKAVTDSLNHLAWVDDGQVYALEARKMYASGEGHPCILIRVTEEGP